MPTGVESRACRFIFIVDACKGLGHTPGDLDPHLFGVRKDAGFLAHEVQRSSRNRLPALAGHPGHIGQVVVDHIHVGGVHIDGNGLLHVAVKR